MPQLGRILVKVIIEAPAPDHRVVRKQDGG
jgi:hypothetical protein